MRIQYIDGGEGRSWLLATRKLEIAAGNFFGDVINEQFLGNIFGAFL